MSARVNTVSWGIDYIVWELISEEWFITFGFHKNEEFVDLPRRYPTSQYWHLGPSETPITWHGVGRWFMSSAREDPRWPLYALAYGE